MIDVTAIGFGTQRPQNLFASDILFSRPFAHARFFPVTCAYCATANHVSRAILLPYRTLASNAILKIHLEEAICLNRRAVRLRQDGSAFLELLHSEPRVQKFHTFL